MTRDISYWRRSGSHTDLITQTRNGFTIGINCSYRHKINVELSLEEKLNFTLNHFENIRLFINCTHTTRRKIKFIINKNFVFLLWFQINKHCEVLVSCSNWVDWIDLIELHLDARQLGLGAYFYFAFHISPLQLLHFFLVKWSSSVTQLRNHTKKYNFKNILLQLLLVLWIKTEALAWHFFIHLHIHCCSPHSLQHLWGWSSAPGDSKGRTQNVETWDTTIITEQREGRNIHDEIKIAPYKTDKIQGWSLSLGFHHFRHFNLREISRVVKRELERWHS